MADSNNARKNSNAVGRIVGPKSARMGGGNINPRGTTGRPGDPGGHMWPKAPKTPKAPATNHQPRVGGTGIGGAFPEQLK